MRKAKFSGSFYPNNKQEIIDMFDGLSSGLSVEKVKGVISPHAGYIYSGATAYKTLSSVKIPDTCLVLCPNHRGVGEIISVNMEDSWETPFGPVNVDYGFSERVLEFKGARSDTIAHAMEHSLEVQLPILKMLNNDVRICAVSIGTNDKNLLSEFSSHLADIIDFEKHLIVASSDMSHFISAEKAEELDFTVVDKIREFDIEGMVDTVIQKRVSMCGIFPAYIMMHVCAACGADSAEVVEYTHSGVVTGDDSDVVAYLGMRIK